MFSFITFHQEKPGYALLSKKEKNVAKTSIYHHSTNTIGNRKKHPLMAITSNNFLNKHNTQPLTADSFVKS